VTYKHILILDLSRLSKFFKQIIIVIDNFQTWCVYFDTLIWNYFSDHVIRVHL